MKRIILSHNCTSGENIQLNFLLLSKLMQRKKKDRSKAKNIHEHKILFSQSGLAEDTGFWHVSCVVG
jgi:hypothetical protein